MAGNGAPLAPLIETWWRWRTGDVVRVIAAMLVAGAASGLLIAAVNDVVLAAQGWMSTAAGPSPVPAAVVGTILLAGAPSAVAILVFSSPERRGIRASILVGPSIIAVIALTVVAMWTPPLLTAGAAPLAVVAWFVRPLATIAVVVTVFLGTSRLFGVLPSGRSAPAAGAPSEIRTDVG